MGDADLRRYIDEIRRVPHPARAEMQVLLAKAREGDETAQVTFIQALLELAAVLARHLAPTGMRWLDAIQEANLVLMQLVEDPSVEEPVLVLPAAIAQHFEGTQR